MVLGAVSSLLSIWQGSHPCDDLKVSLEADCLNLYYVCLRPSSGWVCLWWGGGGVGFAYVVFISFLHVLGQLAVSRLIAHLGCYSGNQAILAASDRATLALRIRTSALLRGTEANVFRGIFLLRLSSCTCL